MGVVLGSMTGQSDTSRCMHSYESVEGHVIPALLSSETKKTYARKAAQSQFSHDILLWMLCESYKHSTNHHVMHLVIMQVGH